MSSWPLLSPFQPPADALKAFPDFSDIPFPCLRWPSATGQIAQKCELGERFGGLLLEFVDSAMLCDSHTADFRVRQDDFVPRARALRVSPSCVSERGRMSEGVRECGSEGVRECGSGCGGIGSVLGEMWREIPHVQMLVLPVLFPRGIRAARAIRADPRGIRAASRGIRAVP